MRVKAITGEFSKYNAYIYPTEGDDISGVVYSGQEVLSKDDNLARSVMISIKKNY